MGSARNPPSNAPLAMRLIRSARCAVADLSRSMEKPWRRHQSLYEEIENNPSAVMCA